jgi:hypothetical protein
MSLETMTKLATTTVGSGGSATIEFTNIPQHFTDLKVLVSGRSSTTTTGIDITFNDSATGYINKRIYAAGSGSGASDSSSNTYISNTMIVDSSYTANAFGSGEIYISNYASNNYKIVSVDGTSENNATTSLIMMTAGQWTNPSPITSIKLNSNVGSFVQHTTVTLYGIKNARQTLGNSIKATGGNIRYDGSYVYHIFNSTDSFSPSSSIYAEVLAVGGGGGTNGDAQASGGGGAGGVSYSSRVLFTPGVPYTAFVGAGATGAINTQINGGDSGIVGLTVAYGGGAGGIGRNSSAGGNGSAGGSGGGGGSSNTNNDTTGGAGVTGQGYAGGGGRGSTDTNRSSGGGGGAGGAGSGVYLGYAGAGGVGTSTYSSWKIGHFVNGAYYLAGGGGGGGKNAGGAGGYGGGGTGGYGGNNTTITAGMDGLANTGGGAGSGYEDNGPWERNNGGSGIVVIRYKG